MSNNEKYIKLITKIFECTNLMKEALPDQDNISYIEGIEEYKDDVIEASKKYSKEKKKNMEELGK